MAIAAMYLRIKGITGESLAGNHAGEIDLISWGWGMTAGSPLSDGSSGSAASMRTINVVKQVDRARELLRAGELAASLAVLQDQVRGDPSNAEKRVFLFQLLSVLGQWERAATQLEVAAELDAKTLAMAQMYREALKCEALRVDVFAGRKSPLIFGEPEEWLALLIEALLVQGSERGGQADALRARARELAPASSRASNR